MSYISTISHRHSLCPRLRHCFASSGETRILATGAPDRRSAQQNHSADFWASAAALPSPPFLFMEAS
jgi:hypothetical protein